MKLPRLSLKRQKLLALTVISLFTTAYCKHAQSELVEAKITIDFKQSIHSKPEFGFLNSLDPSVPKKYITALKATLWRFSPSDIPIYRKEKLNLSHIQVVLSEDYGYPFNNWGGYSSPWENGGKVWREYVRDIARQYRNIKNIYWDVWNEPDSAEWQQDNFWNGTDEQFYETYKIAYQTLRQELGSTAMIGGPSHANFNIDKIKAFLDYCQKHQLEVNILSWHELDETDNNIPSIEEHLVSIRKLLANYPNLHIQKIVINESVGQKAQKRTGDILAYLYYLQRGKADGIIKACWRATDKSNDCYNGSLDGLIDPQQQKPRAAWWVYKFYADSLSKPALVESVAPNYVAIASQEPRQILLANIDDAVQKGQETVLLNLKNLNKPLYKIKLYMLPNTEETVLEKPLFITQLTGENKNGEMHLMLPPLIPKTAYLLKLY